MALEEALQNPVCAALVSAVAGAVIAPIPVIIGYGITRAFNPKESKDTIKQVFYSSPFLGIAPGIFISLMAEAQMEYFITNIIASSVAYYGSRGLSKKFI